MECVWSEGAEEQLIQAPGHVTPARARTYASFKKMVSCGLRDPMSTFWFSAAHHFKNSSIWLVSLEKLSGGSQVHWSSVNL